MDDINVKSVVDVPSLDLVHGPLCSDGLPITAHHLENERGAACDYYGMYHFAHRYTDGNPVILR